MSVSGCLSQSEGLRTVIVAILSTISPGLTCSCDYEIQACLAQMVRFAELRRQGSATLTERRLMLEQHQHSLQQHIQELEQHMATLQHKIARIKELEAQQDVASHPAQEIGRAHV